MRILTVTTLWPNVRQPVHGIFVRERIRAMARKTTVIVIAPVPWVPKWVSRIIPSYTKYCGIDPVEMDGDLTIYHPRFLTFPKILKACDGIFMAISSLLFIRRMKIRWNFDLVDGHWLYPDGMAALILGKSHGTPVAVTVRGDDIRTFSIYFFRRLMIRYVLRRVDWVWTVCEDLRSWVWRLTPELANVEVSRNGIDIKKFRPLNKMESRRTLGFSREGSLILNVGRIESHKGQHLMVEAMKILVSRGLDCRLILAGPVDDISFEVALRRLVRENDIEDRVIFAGSIPHETLPTWYSASDIFVLASDDEGCPNSLVEAMACQIPVVVTPVGGVPELVQEGIGCVFVERNACSIAEGIEKSLGVAEVWKNDPPPLCRDIRNWDLVAEELVRRYESICAKFSLHLIRT
jgi:glycosyltransferase involved in cell wall biosynthesis